MTCSHTCTCKLVSGVTIVVNGRIVATMGGVTPILRVVAVWVDDGQYFRQEMTGQKEIVDRSKYVAHCRMLASASAVAVEDVEVPFPVGRGMASSSQHQQRSVARSLAAGMAMFDVLLDLAQRGWSSSWSAMATSALTAMKQNNPSEFRSAIVVTMAAAMWLWADGVCDAVLAWMAADATLSDNVAASLSMTASVMYISKTFANCGGSRYGCTDGGRLTATCKDVQARLHPLRTQLMVRSVFESWDGDVSHLAMLLPPLPPPPSSSPSPPPSSSPPRCGRT